MKTVQTESRKNPGFSFDGVYYTPLEMRDLRVDPDYQREISKTAINKAVNNFNRRGLRPITVSKRKDGFYYIIDGQHRYEIALSVGMKIYPCCEVHEDLTKAEESSLFVLLNNVKKVGPLAKFRADQVCGDRTAKEISVILQKYDFVIGQPRKDSPNAIACVQALRNIYEGNSKKIFDSTIRVVRSFFASKDDISTKGLKDWFFLGIAAYLFNYEGDADKVIEVFLDSKPESIMKAAFDQGNREKIISRVSLASILAVYIDKRVRISGQI